MKRQKYNVQNLSTLRKQWKWSIFFEGTCLMLFFVTACTSVRFVNSPTTVSATTTWQSIIDRVIIGVRLHNIDVCRSAPGFITHSRPPLLVLWDLLWYQTLYHIALSKQTLYDKHVAIERAAFTLRVSQMEAVTLVISTTGEKNSVEGGETKRRVFVCFRKYPGPFKSALEIAFLSGEVCP